MLLLLLEYLCVLRLKLSYIVIFGLLLLLLLEISLIAVRRFQWTFRSIEQFLLGERRFFLGNHIKNRRSFLGLLLLLGLNVLLWILLGLWRLRVIIRLILHKHIQIPILVSFLSVYIIKLVFVDRKSLYIF